MCELRARNGMRYDRLWLVRKHDFDEMSDRPTKRNTCNCQQSALPWTLCLIGSGGQLDHTRQNYLTRSTGLSLEKAYQQLATYVFDSPNMHRLHAQKLSHNSQYCALIAMRLRSSHSESAFNFMAISKIPDAGIGVRECDRARERTAQTTERDK